MLVLPQDTDIPAVPANRGFEGSGNPDRRRSRDPIEKRRKDLPTINITLPNLTGTVVKLMLYSDFFTDGFLSNSWLMSSRLLTGHASFPSLEVLHGGVGMYVSSHHPVTFLPSLWVPPFNTLWIKSWNEICDFSLCNNHDDWESFVDWLVDFVMMVFSETKHGKMSTQSKPLHFSQDSKLDGLATLFLWGHCCFIKSDKARPATS